MTTSLKKHYRILLLLAGALAALPSYVRAYALTAPSESPVDLRMAAAGKKGPF